MQEYIDLAEFAMDAEDTFSFDICYPPDVGPFSPLFEENVIYENAIYTVIDASYEYFSQKFDSLEKISVKDYQKFLENYIDKISQGGISENRSAQKIFSALAMAANDILDLLIGMTQ